jgi:hypothetical protein
MAMRNPTGGYSGLFAVIFEYLILVVLMIAVPLVVAVDVVWLAHGVKEHSVTEFAQEGLLLLSAILIGLSVRRNTESRGFLVLVAGLFTAMFIREADVYFDMIAKGSWLYPALAVSLLAIVYASRQRGTVIAPLVSNLRTKSFTYIVVGLILVVLFSRLFGTGQLWQAIMGEDYRSLYKSIIQEGLELLGYVLICFGCVSYYLQKPGSG